MAELHVVNAPEGVALEFIREPDDFVVEQPRAAIVASMVFGSLVFVAMAIAPILLGALVEAGRLTNETLGRVATLETFGIAIGATFGPAYLRRGRLGVKLALVCVALVAADLAGYRASNGLAIGALRGVAGLLEGMVLAGANLVLTYVRNPERMNGYFLSVANVLPTVASYALSSFAIHQFGVNIGFGVLAIAAAAGAVAALAVTDRSTPPRPAAKSGASAKGLAVVLGVLAVFLQNAGVGAGFTYIVQIATQTAVPDGVVGLAMAGLQVAAVAGALVVGWGAWRLNYVAMLTLGCLLEAAVVIALAKVHSSTVYLVASCLFGLCWNGLLPYSLTLLIKFDPTRRLALLNTPVSLSGLAIGPFLASFVVGKSNVAPAFFLAAVIFVTSAALYVIAPWIGQKRRAEPTLQVSTFPARER